MCSLWWRWLLSVKLLLQSRFPEQFLSFNQILISLFNICKYIGIVVTCSLMCRYSFQCGNMSACLDHTLKAGLCFYSFFQVSSIFHQLKVTTSVCSISSLMKLRHSSFYLLTCFKWLSPNVIWQFPKAQCRKTPLGVANASLTCAPTFSTQLWWELRELHCTSSGLSPLSTSNSLWRSVFSAGAAAWRWLTPTTTIRRLGSVLKVNLDPLFVSERKTLQLLSSLDHLSHH